MHAYIIYLDRVVAIGYVQFYNKHDFPPAQNYNTNDLPKNCAGLDIYIGEEKYLGKGWL